MERGERGGSIGIDLENEELVGGFVIDMTAIFD
jgi:hypothetical protein